MRMPIVIEEQALFPPDIIILAAKAERPGAGGSTCVTLRGFCFKLTIPLIQQWQCAVSPGKQISGQFNSVNPRNSNRPSARMELDILT